MSVIYIYDEHLKVVDISDTNAMETVKIDMSINEASTLDIASTFKFPDEMRYVALRDPIAQRRNHEEDEFLMYRISSSAIEDDGLFSYTFTEFAYDELAYDGYIVEQRPNQSTFNDGLDLILSGTKWKRGLTNIEGTEDLDFFYLTRIEAISELNKKFPAEFRFWLRLKDDGTIEERIVDAVQKRGQNTGKRFETTSNLISLVAEDDFTNVYSAIVPRGKGEEIDADGDPNTRPGYGRKISIKDVVWSKAKGDPLNKPKGQEWLALENGETLVDGRLRYKIVNFDDDTDPNVLINHAYVQLLKDSVVKRQFTANALDLGVSELGDTVQLVDKERRMEYQARIFHVVYDMVDPTNTEVEFGDNIRSESSISNVISNVVIKQDQILNDTNWAIQQADGKNTTYYGKDEPSVAVREGDIWFREQDNATTQMYRYEGGAWVARDSMNPQRILENFYKNGELDASRINVININAMNIIGKNAQFVKASWDDAYGSSVEITGNAVNFKFQTGTPGMQIRNRVDQAGFSITSNIGISSGAFGEVGNFGGKTSGFTTENYIYNLNHEGITVGDGTNYKAENMAWGISMKQGNGAAPQLIWAGYRVGSVKTDYKTWDNPAGWILPENIRFSTWDNTASYVWFDNSVNVNMQALDFRITHYNDSGVFAHKWQGKINGYSAIGMTTGTNQSGWAVTGDDTWLFVHGQPYSVYQILSKVGMI